MRLANNIISRMALSQRCSSEEDKADEVRRLVREMTELAGKFNLSDSIWFCRNLDVQGFRKRLRDVRDRYDAMMERIIKEHREARDEKRCGGSKVKDLLDILLDYHDDLSSEIRLTMENIKAFIMVAEKFHLLSLFKCYRSIDLSVLNCQTRNPFAIPGILS